MRMLPRADIIVYVVKGETEVALERRATRDFHALIPTLHSTERHA